jgi:hypothetical protein
MKTSSSAVPVKEIGTTLAELLKTQARLGTQLVDIVSQVKLPRSQSCCDIPEPCWMPVELGEIESFACPGATSVVRLVITNCDRVPHNYSVSATGADAGLVNLQPATLSLGPKERGQVLATLKISPDAKDSQDFEVLLWIRGCKEYFLRWTVEVGSRGGDCCHEVEVDDCPDLIHHWYDHFYCARPCYFDGKPGKHDG